MRPYSPYFDEHYWSPAGGALEKQTVFIDGSHLSERFSAMQPQSHLTIAELGLGTGLNVALAATCFAHHAHAGAKLQIISYEAHSLPLAELQAIHASLPADLQPYLATVQQLWPKLQPGWNTCVLGPLMYLHLWVGDALSGIVSQPHKADAWFLDGFSPAKNPELWSLPLFQQAAAQSQPNATVATYSVARMVRDNLQAAGFQVQKVPGVQPKRDRLVGALKA